jgi:hypothetical protein
MKQHVPAVPCCQRCPLSLPLRARRPSPPPSHLQLRLKDAALPKLLEQAAVLRASLSAGCPLPWAAGRFVVVCATAFSVTAASEVATRRLFLRLAGAGGDAPA